MSSTPIPVEGLSPHDDNTITQETPQLDAYALLTKPTLDLSDAEVDAIITNLQKRRKVYLDTGKADAPAKEAAARKALAEPKAKPTAADKKANTAALLDSIDWKL